MTLTTHDGMLFGIYPGGVTGDDTGGLASGLPDDPALVSSALDRLQGRPGRPFLVRAYIGFDDATRLGEPHATATPAAAAQYAIRGRRLDLVAQYQSPAGDVDGYCDFLRELVEQYGAVTSTLQVTEEPNVTSNPTLDGYYPAVHEAIVRGVSVVKARARELGHTDLRVGFNTTPLFGPATSFLTDLTNLGEETSSPTWTMWAWTSFPTSSNPSTHPTSRTLSRDCYVITATRYWHPPVWDTYRCTSPSTVGPPDPNATRSGRLTSSRPW